MKITVFGSASPRPETPAYDEALRLGLLLGQAGHTVLTGGYMGTMEAVSRGAAQAGAKIIGVTCAEIEQWRPTRANPWVNEEWRMPTLAERLDQLITQCDAALALPGGAGTLAEIALMWNRLIIGSLSPRPLILIGPAWHAVFDALFTYQNGSLGEREKQWLRFADTVEQAAAFLA